MMREGALSSTWQFALSQHDPADVNGCGDLRIASKSSPRQFAVNDVKSKQWLV
jgi:hypothetical protein